MTEFVTYREVPSGDKMIEVKLYVEYDWDSEDLYIEDVTSGNFKYLQINGENVKVSLTEEESADVDSYLENLDREEETYNERTNGWSME